MSRMISNRLKSLMPSIISSSQSAFLSGRLITDNVITAFEAYHSMKGNWSGSNNHDAIKLDMAKDFDRIEWCYLKEVMKRMGFPRTFIDLIMKMVTSVEYKILVNGSPTAPIKPTRGLRQGDPLSPFLFIICAEGLSAMIQQSVDSGLLKGLTFGSAGPILSHLLFADDSLIFIEASIPNASQLNDILHRYELASGQQINKRKSSIFFSKGVCLDTQDALVSTLGICKGDGTGHHLGLPYMTGRSKRAVFSYVRNRVWIKLSGWKERFLSAAGKEVLIKSIIQAIPTYIMQCFALPKTLLNDIEAMIRRFFWGSKDQERKIHWKAWSTCIQPKGRGGLGFRDLEAFNLAMLAKQAWRLLKSPDTIIGKMVQSKYFLQTCFLEVGSTNRSSYLWKSLLKGRDLLKKGYHWKVGNGMSIKVFEDPWVPTIPAFVPTRSVSAIFEAPLVSDLIVKNGTWNETLIRSLFWDFECGKIFSIPLVGLEEEDQLIWHYHPKGQYTVKSGYHVALEGNQLLAPSPGPSSSNAIDSMLWKILWSSPTQPRVKHFIWRLLHDCLPTSHNLARCGMANDVCQLCGMEAETVPHTFRNGIIPKALRLSSTGSTKWLSCDAVNIQQVLYSVFSSDGNHGFSKFCNILWQLWKARCSFIFEGKGVRIPTLISMAESQSEEYIRGSESSMLPLQNLFGTLNGSRPITPS